MLEDARMAPPNHRRRTQLVPTSGALPHDCRNEFPTNVLQKSDVLVCMQVCMCTGMDAIGTCLGHCWGTFGIRGPEGPLAEELHINVGVCK